MVVLSPKVTSYSALQESDTVKLKVCPVLRMSEVMLKNAAKWKIEKILCVVMNDFITVIQENNTCRCYTTLHSTTRHFITRV